MSKNSYVGGFLSHIVWSVGRVYVKNTVILRFVYMFVSHVMHYMKYLCQNSFVGGFLSHIV